MGDESAHATAPESASTLVQESAEALAVKWDWGWALGWALGWVEASLWALAWAVSLGSATGVTRASASAGN